MKFIINLIVLFAIVATTVYSQSAPEHKISGSFENIDFRELVSQLEEDYPLRFYYRDDWIEEVTVNFQADSTPLNELLDRVLIHTFLGFEIMADGKVYILPDKSFVSELPRYTLDAEIYESSNGEQEQLVIEEKYLRGRQPDMIETIVIGKAEQGRRNKPAIINGKLIDEETGEPLIGATLYIKELRLGAVTDRDGVMSVALKPGKYAASFQCLGMANIKCILDVQSDGYFNLKLKPQVTSIAEVTIKADETYSRGSKAGLETMAIKTIKELPTFMGERDVMKIAQMLPGVVSVGEGATGVNVRGGNVDQNLFYLNEIPVYNSSHLFGFFSAINTNIIKNFSIYKGQIPAKYGGRLSSVFNVETRKGNKNKFFAQGGISPVSAQLSAEYPVVKNKATVMVSARSSYSDWILNQMDDPALRNSDARFYDLTLGADYEINSKNHLYLFAYHSKDYFNFNGLTDYEYANTGGSLDYVHRFSPGLKSSLAIVFSNYDFSTIEQGSISTAYEHQYQLKHQEFKYTMNWLINEKHTVNGGLSSIYYQLERGDVKPYGEESRLQIVPLGVETGVESAVFIDDTYSPFYWFSLYAGLRYSFYNELGPKQVLEYFPDQPKSETTVSGSTEYSSGEVVSSYHGPEFRLAADFKINNLHSLKFSFTQMRQYLFMLSNTVAVAPTDQWKLADSYLTPPKSNQYSAGYYFDHAETGISASVEGYYKEAQNIVEYKDGADFLSTPHVETITLQGDQTAYGIEFMLAKNKGHFNGWISYAYARSQISVDGENYWEKINNGITYPANYDKPHVLNVVANVRINRRVSLSSNLAYSTGRPITLPQSIFYVNNNPYVEYTARNAYRIPDYFRMDISLTIEGNLKRKKFMHSYWVFSIYNLTGRKNAYSVYFVSEDGLIKGYQYSVIGIPIFTVTWNFKLGNYASN